MINKTYIYYLLKGHNWIDSPSRAFRASTQRPCLPMLNSDPQIQVGPNQDFEVQFSGGHEELKQKYSYFVLVKQTDEDLLNGVNTDDINEYIQAAPGSATSYYNGLEWEKHHRAEKGN